MKCKRKGNEGLDIPVADTMRFGRRMFSLSEAELETIPYQAVDHAAVERLLSRVKLKNPPFPIQLRYRYGQIFAEFTILDRETGLPGHVTHVMWASSFTGLPSDLALEEIYRWLKGAFIHELDECFHVDGKRVHDPHKSPFDMVGMGAHPDKIRLDEADDSVFAQEKRELENRLYQMGWADSAGAKAMKPKYAVHPGFVYSAKDEDRHFISATRLMELYGVNPKECLVVDERKPKNLYLEVPEGLVHLYPRRDGNYEL